MLRARVHLVLLLAASGASAGAQSTPVRDLLTELPGIQGDIEPGVGVIQQRLVGIDPVLLETLDPGEFVRLQLFPGITRTVLITEQRACPRPSRGFVGSIEGENLGDLVMVTRPGILAASVRTEEHGLIRIRSVRGLVHLVEQIDESLMPGCGTDERHHVNAPMTDDGQNSPADDGTQFDVMAVWTKAAQDSVGGMESMNAVIDLAVLETNLAYEDSGVTARLRLVYKGKVGYDESTDFGGHLSRLAGTSDGYMDEVHAIRTAVGADVVSLIVQDGQYCGIAYLMTNLSNNFKSSAFSVVHYGCATGYYSFGHEIGHNQGCHHDHDNGGGALFAYSYGYRFYGNSGRQYRTMLAYSPGTRIRRLSNPDETYDGVPTGVPGNGNDAADNARSLDNASNTVANWYNEVNAPTSLLFSTRNDRTLGGVSWKDEDIVLLDLDTGAISMMVDMSDLVPTDVDLTALAVTGDPTEILVVFNQTVDLPGLTGGPNGDTVEPQDVVLLRVTQFGNNTTGSFEFWIDGSDIELNKKKERIDALGRRSNGRLYMSFTGGFKLNGGTLTGKDEDLVRFVPTTTGANTSGTWRLEMDGSATDTKINSKGEDVDAHHYQNGKFAVSTTGNFRVPSNRIGQDEDLIMFLSTDIGVQTAGTWMNLFNGDHYGLTIADIDALHINN